MGRKTKKQLAKEEYERYEAEWLNTHNKNEVNNEYAIQVALHCKRIGELQTEDTSNYYLASLLACALYSINEETEFYQGYLAQLYEVIPKDKVDIYAFGGIAENDQTAANLKYNELEYVEKYRK